MRKLLMICMAFLMFASIGFVQACGQPNWHRYDLNDDNQIDIFDIVIIASRYGLCRGECEFEGRYDFNHNGIIDLFDVMQVASRFGTGM